MLYHILIRFLLKETLIISPSLDRTPKYIAGRYFFISVIGFISLSDIISHYKMKDK